MTSPRIGAIFQPSFPPERLRAAVEAAEAAGVPEVWLWEDCFRESAFATASAALAWTERLRIGIGIAPMPMRNVATLAMEIATIERLFPGRLIPGVGHGVLDWMGQIGARVASPLTLMREYAPALRALLAGEEVTTDGRYVRLDRVRLDWPPASPPAVFAAGEGPKTLHLTGEVADGTIIPAGASTERIAESAAIVRAGREAAGLDGPPEIVVFLNTAFGGDDARARAIADLATWDATADPSRVAAGDLDEVVATVDRYAAAGATAVILQPTADEPDLEGFMGSVGEVVRRVAG
ncbi:LLM class flavin-dependent oxidoreductase [Agromyces sp. CFH 90414]|uniref:LLM class flavin-dependent oxidoreductase n=1 Tax=Agromyces agglutinans TaxID=2662258 RepID=A0A6I2F6X2_9MICO|nr:LLM class flavin-dependent oxidoreductase [Agromyces agglutinans]MRG61235.1 LLM class flavin-dependent oxidoreductase [Agromyces agglutinans]